MSKQTISAIFDTPEEANKAISVLRAKGHKDAEFSVLASESSVDTKIELEKNTKAPEGITLGATTGGAAGAIFAGLSAVGAITLTGGVPLLAAGPVVAAFAGAGAGATAGGLIGGLVGMGIPETEAKLIEERLGSGNVLVGMTVDDQIKTDTKKIFESTGAKKVSVH